MICLFGLLYSTSAHAAKLYKWVDTDGKVSYQDKPPPKNAKLIETSELTTTSQEEGGAGSGGANQASKIPARTDPVMVYTVTNCNGCKQLMTFLRMQNVPTIELSLQDREVQARVLSLSGKLSAPTVFIGDKLVEDLSEAKLSEELTLAGYTVNPDINLPSSTTEAESAAEQAGDETSSPEEETLTADDQ